MNIIHYILGFPPHRTGGLTKYALDLMEAEKALGHEVATLYPGNFSLCSSKSALKEETPWNGMPVFLLTNGMPVPLMYGVSSPEAFRAKREIEGFEAFVNKIKPDVFHVHTLMGLPKELLVLMKVAGVKIVYTSHDYYGLCPRVNFIDSEGKVCDGASAEKCADCCRKSPGLAFLKVRNSKVVVPLKKLLR